MLHYAHQLVSNAVCLLLVLGRLENSGFIKTAENWKQLPAAGDKVDESGESEPSGKVAGQKNQNDELKDTKSFVVLRGTAESGHNSQSPFFTTIDTFHTTHSRLKFDKNNWLE